MAKGLLLNGLEVLSGRPIPLVVLLSIITFILWSSILNTSSKKKYHLPNLVPGLPIIGNAHQIPSQDFCLHVEKLAKSYGGKMFTLKFGKTFWVFLNNTRDVNELLEKRAAKSSSRMDFPMAAGLMSNHKRMLLLPYGDLWRRERKVAHSILNVNQQNLFQPFQDVESKALLYNYLQDPSCWWKAHGSFSASVIMSVIFGRRAAIGDANTEAALKCSEQFEHYLEPGRAVVDVLPFLMKIPWLKNLQPWRWYGDAQYRRTLGVYRKEMDDLRERRRLGTQKPCFMSELLDSKQDAQFSEEELLFIGGAMIEAGTGTTRLSLHQCVAAAVACPDWPVRVRAQLDQVCGANAERLPDFNDATNLPLIKAAVKESFRWKPTVAETGVPHTLSEDDSYMGFTIPSGSIIVYNHWAIANSSSEYEQPDRFWPERFLNDDLDKPTKGHLGFGTGRRVCVGYNVGVSNMFIALARLLYCFEFEPVPSAPIDLSSPRLLRGSIEKAGFEVKIKVRSEAHRQLIERECRDVAL
ncbi:hypothetical protein BGAL_0471g00020 [Botrytis galanthina]|uniref:Cytochrome P450 n=1 Tax=Botrytis galanthina TaxID=278940 RepID=A0A4S8QPG9_9HELO|nr:hypothetical protein BGAL_0471g00020 [Botrytis galanthina]